jgi:hypothetical protein
MVYVSVGNCLINFDETLRKSIRFTCRKATEYVVALGRIRSSIAPVYCLTRDWS